MSHERNSPAQRGLVAGRAPGNGQFGTLVGPRCVNDGTGVRRRRSPNLYGGTYQLFHYTLPKLGRTVKFVNSKHSEAFRAAIMP